MANLSRIRPLRTSIMMGGALLVLALCTSLSALNYFGYRRTLYERYEHYLSNVLSYASANIDVDDLEACMASGVKSERYGELQRTFDTMKDTMELDFIYIIVPLNANPTDNIKNVIAGMSSYEYEHEPDNTVELNELTGDSYSAETAKKYLDAYQSGKMSFFAETAEWGEDYTGLLPLFDSAGKPVAALCADIDISGINAMLRASIVRRVVIIAGMVLAFFAAFMAWAYRHVTHPLEQIETRVVEFAAHCRDQKDPDALGLDLSDIRTGNEVETLARAATQVGEAMQEYLRGMVSAENAARDAETIVELKESITSLLNNMPALTFSKNADTGVYLACNQAFAEYAHRSSPDDVAGLTDFEIFDPVTAAHFVEDDKLALSMDEPYVLFEDVADAAGNPRQFQTTKLKFYDTSGRLCLLGMSMDVTETVRVRKEREQAQAAYREALSANAIYESVVDALAEDYFDLYYVDVETSEYVEYGSRTESGERTDERRGRDFFTETRENVLRLVHEEDRELVLEMLDRERLLGEIARHGTLTLHYRLLIGGAPTYVSMKATRSHGDERHVIIGVSNVDSQVKDRMAAERATEERKSYQRLAALNGNLIVLYFVDPQTGAYTEFSSTQGYEGLGIAKQGEDFFTSSQENGTRTIHPEDLTLFRTQATKENILATIERDGVFLLDYRLMSGDLPTYVRYKAAKVEEDGKDLLIVGLLNEDTQIRQEQEYAQALSVARRMAVIDSLTGVKNKHAYTQWEDEINERIARGTQRPFAVVVCDINNLKAVNDLYGHKEGDACIKNACSRICSIFAHSPVFRVGGDEFVIIMAGEDYERRAQLMAQVNEVPQDRTKVRIGETVSAGMVEYQPGHHHCLVNVFEEADRAMYERKQQMKSLYGMAGDREDAGASD